ncbi:MAG: hypothetical protein M3Q33_14140 [Acidobacteriota bacterium]|nr:hypothetical protein [Acidobacteriota bacterium]
MYNGKTMENAHSDEYEARRFRTFNLGKVTTINNLSQFTKYSRRHWHLL